jgi:hypothetical protein
MAKGLTFVLALVAALTGHAAEPAGYVLVVQGRWLETGRGVPLTVGAPVPAGAQLMAIAPAPGDRITVIAARTGNVLVARRCDATSACRRPLVVPAAPAPAEWDSWLSRVFAAIADQPDRYVTALSRAAPPPADAVLVWDAGRLHLEPILAGRPEGVFEVSLMPLACPGEPRCADAPVEARLVWSPPVPLLTVELQRPGLFELALHRVGDAATLSPERNWVLAVAPAEVAAARERLRVATGLADGWGADVDADAKRAFIRATLSTPAP